MLYAAMYQRYQSSTLDRTIGAADAGAAAANIAAELREGDVVGRLEIPRLGLSVMVLQGTDPMTLAVGAGHVPGTPLPGVGGNVAIAAHRDTLFRKLAGIRPGDIVRLTTVRRRYEYAVDSTEIVDPEDTQVLESRARAELTLITCYPFDFIGPAPRRFIVHAR